ncbi:MAG TPA: HAD family hydrolase [Candidatus Dormibacteraeota bacterium]|nr:HAD family hydrolase [Candidatus Dormibacteraeota bacterium]
MGRKAVFLDRDGILNRERTDYVKTPEEFEMLAGVEGPIRKMHERRYLMVVVTNQSAVGRGFTTLEILGRIHDKMLTELERLGCTVDGVYYCPHTPADDCSCRKPRPGLILKAVEDFGIDLAQSWLIGDKESDVEAARRAGCRGVIVPSNGNGLEIGVREILAREDSKIRVDQSGNSV